jgi:hypothetical protein
MCTARVVRVCYLVILVPWVNALAIIRAVKCMDLTAARHDHEQKGGHFGLHATNARDTGRGACSQAAMSNHVRLLVTPATGLLLLGRNPKAATSMPGALYAFGLPPAALYIVQAPPCSCMYTQPAMRLQPCMRR